MIFLDEQSGLVNRIEDMLERLRLIEPVIPRAEALRSGENL